MKKMNVLFSTVLRSCTDFKFYKEIFYQPFGKTVRYLVILVVLVTVLLGIRYSIIFSNFSKKGMQWVEKNAPYIEITDGIVAADVKQPFITEEEGFLMIIDTTGETKGIDSNYKTGVLLTKNKLIVKQDEVRTQEFDLSKVKSFQLDKETLSRWRKVFIIGIIPIMIIMQFGYAFIAKIVQALVAGLAVLIFKPRLQYSNILNVCVYALTPPTLLAVLIVLIAPKPLLFFPIIYLGMYIAFIVGGIRQAHTE